MGGPPRCRGPQAATAVADTTAASPAPAQQQPKQSEQSSHRDTASAPDLNLGGTMQIVRSRKGRFAALVTTGVLSLGAIGAPAASAQPQIGLVNIDLDVSRNNIAVLVPVNAAASSCGVSVAVLTVVLAPAGVAFCAADADQQVELVQRQ